MGTSLLRLQETSSKRRQEMSHGVTYRKVWARPQDVIFQRPKVVVTGRPQDVGRGRPQALYHMGRLQDVFRGVNFLNGLYIFRKCRLLLEQKYITFFCELFLYLISKTFKILSLMESLFLLKDRAKIHRTLLNVVTDVLIRMF